MKGVCVCVYEGEWCGGGLYTRCMVFEYMDFFSSGLLASVVD